jgi:hypothetical protein
MREKLEKCRNVTILEQTVSLKSALTAEQLPELDALVEALHSTF